VFPVICPRHLAASHVCTSALPRPNHCLTPPCAQVLSNRENGLSNCNRRCSMLHIFISLFFRYATVLQFTVKDSSSLFSLPIRFVCGYLFSVWKIKTYLQRSVHDWRPRRVILFPNIGGSITCALDILQLR
jgi:hypothetical protein